MPVKLGLELRPLQHNAPIGLALDGSIAASSSGLYGTSRPGSIPHDADTTTFGCASSIRPASLFAANPPNTTE